MLRRRSAARHLATTQHVGYPRSVVRAVRTSSPAELRANLQKQVYCDNPESIPPRFGSSKQANFKPRPFTMATNAVVPAFNLNHLKHLTCQLFLF